MQQVIHGIPVRGRLIDSHTRCVHYPSPLDIIAIRFRCCQTYYPCFLCHQEDADHPPQVWPQAEWETRAVLCGACGHEMTIHAYLMSDYRCPFCAARFNPGCSRHYPLYFDVD